MEKDSEAWGGGQSLRPSEIYGEGAKEITIGERERLGKQQKDWGLRDQQKGRQRGPGRVKWHPCRGEGVSDREPERQNLSEKIQRQRLRNETLREEMMRRGREGGREDRNGGTGLCRAAALST